MIPEPIFQISIRTIFNKHIGITFLNKNNHLLRGGNRFEIIEFTMADQLLRETADQLNDVQMVSNVSHDFQLLQQGIYI